MPRVRDDDAIKRATQEAQERFPLEDDFQFMPGDPCAICGVNLGTRDAHGVGAHVGCQKKFAQYTRRSVDDIAPAPQHVWAVLWELFRSQYSAMDTHLERRVEHFNVSSSVQYFLPRRRELLAEYNPARKRAMDLTDARRKRMIDFLTEAYSSGRTPTKEEVEAAINGRAMYEGKGEHERMMYEAAKKSDVAKRLVADGMPEALAANIVMDTTRALALGHKPLCPLTPDELRRGAVVLRPRISRTTGNYYEQTYDQNGFVVSTRAPAGVAPDLVAAMNLYIEDEFCCRLGWETGMNREKPAYLEKYQFSKSLWTEHVQNTAGNAYEAAVSYQSSMLGNIDAVLDERDALRRTNERVPLAGAAANRVRAVKKASAVEATEAHWGRPVDAVAPLTVDEAAVREAIKAMFAAAAADPDVGVIGPASGLGTEAAQAARDSAHALMTAPETAREIFRIHAAGGGSGLQIETSQGRVGPGHSVVPTEQPARKAEENSMTTENEKPAIPGTMSIFTQNVKRAGRNTALKTFNNQLAEAIIAVSKDKFPWVDTVEGRLAMTNAAPLILHQLCVRFPNMFPAASAGRIAALAELASEHAMTDAMEQVLSHFMPMVQAFITVASAALEKMPEDVREELDAKAGKEKEKLPAPSEEQQVVSKRKAAAANKTL